MQPFHSKIDEANEKNKARTDKSTYFVVCGLPSKWEIKSIPVTPNGQRGVWLPRNKGNGSNKSHRDKHRVMSIKLLSIQGLTQVKAVEIEVILTKKNGIICLTETQKKYKF